VAGSKFISVIIVINYAKPAMAVASLQH